MRSYFAGNTGILERETRCLDKIRANASGGRLLSYFVTIANPSTKGIEATLSLYFNYFIEAKKMKVSLFLDSGAFSAYTQGVSIKLDDYIQFIKDNINHIDVYANLDVIGDAEGTLKNQKQMEDAGLSPLPCFHFGSDIKYLKYYLGNYDYIALGGLIMTTQKNIRVWLDEMFSKYICDNKGMPRVKVHGFAMTSLTTIKRYPWFSVDSTSWVIQSRLGSIIVPRFRRGQYNYLLAPWKVSVSDRSPKKSEAGKHISTYTPQQREVIEHYLHHIGYKLGESIFRNVPNWRDRRVRPNERWHGPPKKDGTRRIEIIKKPGVVNQYVDRDEVNILYYLELEKALPPWPWPFKVRGRGFGL